MPSISYPEMTSILGESEMETLEMHIQISIPIQVNRNILASTLTLCISHSGVDMDKDIKAVYDEVADTHNAGFKLCSGN